MNLMLLILDFLGFLVLEVFGECSRGFLGWRVKDEIRWNEKNDPLNDLKTGRATSYGPTYGPYYLYGPTYGPYYLYGPYVLAYIWSSGWSLLWPIIRPIIRLV